MKQLLYVFIGGGVGGALRFLVNKYASTLSSFVPFPTLLVNVLGSFLIGLLVGFYSKNTISHNQSLLLITGFCGGFTTFSTFALENAKYFENGNYTMALLYILLSLVIGVSFVFLGLYVAK